MAELTDAQEEATNAGHDPTKLRDELTNLKDTMMALYGEYTVSLSREKDKRKTDKADIRRIEGKAFSPMYTVMTLCDDETVGLWVDTFNKVNLGEIVWTKDPEGDVMIVSQLKKI